MSRMSVDRKRAPDHDRPAGAREVDRGNDVVAAPGAIYRYWRQGKTGGRLPYLLVVGTLPGVVAGS
jgi:hypothetical protein